ncbi:MAG: phosphate ABC transporter substrate-binding protein [Kofleriaceae bacterium]
MRRTVTALLRVIAIAILMVSVSRADTVGGEAFKVIVNPDNPITTVDRGTLRDLYLKKTIDWSDGTSSVPVDLSTRFPSRDQFTQQVLGKTAAQLKTYWNQQIFSGKGVPPAEADSTADMIAYVLANRGAVGYLPADVDPGRAKVVQVK